MSWLKFLVHGYSLSFIQRGQWREDKYREKKKEAKTLSYPKGHSCISHLIKMIRTTEYLFLEARRLCEAVQMSAKTQRPAPSDDTGYLDIYFLYFNCAKLVLTTWTCWPLGDSVTSSMCFLKDIWDPKWFFCVIFVCGLGLGTTHAHTHTGAAHYAHSLIITPSGDLFQKRKGCPQLSHYDSTFIKSLKEHEEETSPFLLMTWLGYFISALSQELNLSWVSRGR